MHRQTLEHFWRSYFFLFRMASYVFVIFFVCFFWLWSICKYACAHMDAQIAPSLAPETLKRQQIHGIAMSLFIISEQVLARWRCLVAFMKAMDLPHRAMRAVQYRRTATAIEMVDKVDIYCIIIMFSVTLAAVGAILIKQLPDGGVQWLL